MITISVLAFVHLQQNYIFQMIQIRTICSLSCIFKGKTTTVTTKQTKKPPKNSELEFVVPKCADFYPIQYSNELMFRTAFTM